MSEAAKPLPFWKSFWNTLTRFDSSDVSASMAARNSLCVAIPLVIGALLESPGKGLIAASGAINASFADGHEPYKRRLQKMLAASVMCGFAVFAGSSVGSNHGLAIVVSLLWAFAVGMLGSLGTAAADVGNISLFTLCVYASQSMTPGDAALSGLLALGGGLLQTASAFLLWPTRPYAPERRALANLYEALAAVAGSISKVTGEPPATAQMNAALLTLKSLTNDRTAQAERLLGLVQYAERIRLSLLVLVRLRRRIDRELPQDPVDHIENHQTVDAIDSFTRHYETSLRILAHGISLADYSTEPNLAESRRLEGAFLAQPAPLASTFIAAMMRDVARQFETLNEQLDGVLELLLKAIAEKVAVPKQMKPHEPWQLKFKGRAATLLANLSFESAIFRHALRLSMCIAAGDAAGRLLHLERPYWVPMTIGIVLKPDFSATFSRGVLRIIGTMAGLTIATLLFHASPDGVWAHIVFVAVLTFFMRWLGPANYGFVAVTITAVVVIMIAGTGISPKEVIGARAGNTVVGGILALLSYALWPTWEKKKLRPLLADLLEAYRAYFRKTMDAYRGASPASELDPIRHAARVARVNATSSLDRATVEPVTSREELATLNAVLAKANDFVKCVMALEAALPRERRSCDTDAFRQFEDAVDLCLSETGELLRKETKGRDMPIELPAVPQTGLAGGPYSLLNQEAERMARALQLLAETVS